MNIFLQIIRRDLLSYRKIYLGKLFDMLITFVCWVVVFGYFMPLMGTQSEFGVFIMVGAIASFGIFDIIGQAGMMIADINGDRTISHLLLLPLSSTAVFCSIAASWALQSMLMAVPLYFIGKLIFWDQFILSNIVWHQLPFAFITTNLFFGSFALMITGLLHNVSDVGRIYFRFINPLFIFGCYFFSWGTAFKLSRPIGYLCLFDPFSYVMEITRAAVIGQAGFIPFWLSLAALWFFIFICTTIGVRSLRRHLDCI